ncbi:MAG: class I SAM-dependent methyltransferase, partial [Bacteroidales bacterium]|nr:class I SAM-dependent methyltransferase [Bacteroidales bacterium]
LPLKDHFLSRETFTLFRCTECEFIFTQDHPDEKEAGIYYESDDYLSHNDKETGILNSLYRSSRNIMLNKKWKMVKRSSGLAKGNLLDIGSGSGHFAAFMKKKGWAVKGIEINDRVREVSVSRFGLEIHTPDQMKVMSSGGFDCITLWHVLEHLQEPLRYAEEIRRLLRPGGVCIVALPNCDSYDARYYGEFWAAWDVPRHLWHFNPHTFRNFAAKSGFKLHKIRSLPFDVFYISSLSEKYKACRSYFVSGMIKALWFSILTLFARERSSSLVYILKK